MVKSWRRRGREEKGKKRRKKKKRKKNRRDGGMPLYGASLWDSFTTRRFKMPFKTLDRDWWNCAGLNRTFDARTLWCSISCIPTFYLNKKVDASILMQRTVLRLTTTWKGAIFHLLLWMKLSILFAPDPARYSRTETRYVPLSRY